MAKTEKKLSSTKVVLTNSAGDRWVARESSSGRFVIVEPAKKSRRFKASQLRDAVRKVAKSQA